MRKGNSSNFQLFLRYTNIRTRGENEIIQCRIPPSGPPHLKIQINSHCRQQDAGTNEEMFPLVPLVARRRLQVQTSKKCLIRRATLSSRLRSCGQCLSGVTVTGDPDEVKSEETNANGAISFPVPIALPLPPRSLFAPLFPSSACARPRPCPRPRRPWSVRLRHRLGDSPSRHRQRAASQPSVAVKPSARELSCARALSSLSCLRAEPGGGDW